MRRFRQSNSALLLTALLVSLVGSGCLGFGKKAKQPSTNSSAEPDKLLYERAVDDVKHGRYTVGRLGMQTLINTYPDSEYLAKAKLAIADSYYKEGGTSGLTQAVAEYKDFITFFPFLDEAAYAQMQVAMAHYRMMEKPDRDRTQARAAEDEFQTFLLKYPKSPLAAQAEQRLRDVQEVLAEGDYRVARFYYIKGSYSAATARLMDLTNRYPLYSESDHALWMLGEIYEKAAEASKNEDQRAYWKAEAGNTYARIVREYPLSHLVSEAKDRLMRFGQPIPQADPVALARMEKEQQFERHRPGLLHRSLGILRTEPDVSMAARTGEPNLTPPSEVTAANEVLKPGTGSTATVTGTATPGGATSVPVETVPLGSAGGNLPPSEASSTAGTATSYPPSDSATTTTNSPPGSNPGASSNGSATPPKTSAHIDPAKRKNKKAKKESTNKKKKGLRKILPW